LEVAEDRKYKTVGGDTGRKVHIYYLSLTHTDMDYNRPPYRNEDRLKPIAGSQRETTGGQLHANRTDKFIHRRDGEASFNNNTRYMEHTTVQIIAYCILDETGTHTHTIDITMTKQLQTAQRVNIVHERGYGKSPNILIHENVAWRAYTY
jgi:hypothetical protein